jgi:hypothetical protein
VRVQRWRERGRENREEGRREEEGGGGERERERKSFLSMLVKTHIIHMYMGGYKCVHICKTMYIYMCVCVYWGGGVDGWVYLLPEGFVIIDGSLKR